MDIISNRSRRRVRPGISWKRRIALMVVGPACGAVTIAALYLWGHWMIDEVIGSIG